MLLVTYTTPLMTRELKSKPQLIKAHYHVRERTSTQLENGGEKTL